MLSDLRIRLRALFRRKSVEHELDEELRFHIERETEKYIQAGMTPEEAARRARVELGGVEQAKEEHRDARGIRFLEDTWRDIAYAVRMLRKSPGFTIVAILTLALGIGANTAIFSVVNALLLRSLPVKKPGQLALLYSGPRTGTNSGDPLLGRWPLVSFGVYRYFVDHNQYFQGIAAFRSGRDPLEVRWPSGTSGNGVERATGQLVSGGYFEVLGVNSALGRVFGPSDDRPNASPTAVISYDYWANQLHKERDAVGRTVYLNGTPFKIVGVAPPEFFGLRMYQHPPDFWVPLNFQPQVMRRKSLLTQENQYWLNFVGRLKTGVTRGHAQAALTVQLRQFLAAQAGSQPSPREKRVISEAYIQLASGRTGISSLRDLYSEPVRIVMGIVFLVLLVACANVANLLLSRSTARQVEFSMRLVVGATRLRIVRQLLTECVLLSLMGAAVALLLAELGIHLLAALASRELVLNPMTNPTVFAFTLALSFLTGLAFGLVPALSVGRSDIGESLQGGTRVAGGRPSGFTSGLVVVQVAISLVLLTGAGLLVRSIANLEGQNLGFHRDNVLLVQLDPRLAGLREGDLSGLYRRLVHRLNGLPVVRSATIAYYSPMSGHNSRETFLIEGNSHQPVERLVTHLNQIAPAYFKTLGIPLLRGRSIGDQDTATSPKVAVVNQAFAQSFFHGQNPVGRYISFSTRSHPTEIVGLVGDARFSNPGQAPQPFVYVPLTQKPGFFAGNIEVRTAGTALGAAAEVRQAIREVDNTVPITSVQTLRSQVTESLLRPMLVARLSLLFGLLGLTLAAVGLYGVISYSASRRTHEIGIRMAIGAQKASVLRLVLNQGFKLVVIGAAIGVATALALTRLLSSMLYGVAPTDWSTFLTASLVLIAVALLACCIPALRAMRIDPAEALRHE